jgi:hypothetical protein
VGTSRGEEGDREGTSELIHRNPLPLHPLLSGLLCFLLLLSASTAPASDRKTRDGKTPNVPERAWTLSLRGGVAHQFGTGLDDGGSFRVNRLFLQGGPSYAPDYRHSVSLALGFGVDGYDFLGNGGMVSLVPWETVHTFRVSTPVRWGIGRDWTAFVIPTVRMAAETGAALGNSLSGGGFAGFSYRFGNRLTIGPGVGAMPQIEDSPEIFPVLIIDWKITDRLRLETGRGLGASRGPGLILRWEVSDRWDVSLGGRYEKLRFRLDREGGAPDGVGSDRAFPLFCGASYRFSPRAQASLVGGVALGGKLRLEDENGNRITEENYNQAVFMGGSFGVRL